MTSRIILRLKCERARLLSIAPCSLAGLLLTSNAPTFFDQLAYGRPAKNQAVRAVMKFSGIKPVRTLQVGTVKGAKEGKIKDWLRKAYNRGADAGRR